MQVTNSVNQVLPLQPVISSHKPIWIYDNKSQTWMKIIDSAIGSSFQSFQWRRNIRS